MIRTATLTAATCILALTGANAQSPVVTSDGIAATPMHDDRVAPQAAAAYTGVTDAARMVDRTAAGVIGGIASPSSIQMAQNETADEDNAATRAEGERVTPEPSAKPGMTAEPGMAAETMAADEDNAATRADGERVEPNETTSATMPAPTTAANTDSADEDNAATRAEGERVEQ